MESCLYYNCGGRRFPSGMESCLYYNCGGRRFPSGMENEFRLSSGGRKALNVGNATSRRGYKKDEETPFPQGILKVLHQIVHDLFYLFIPWCFVVNESFFSYQFFPFRILLFNQFYFCFPRQSFNSVFFVNCRLVTSKFLVVNTVFAIVFVCERSLVVVVFMFLNPTNQIVCASSV